MVDSDNSTFVPFVIPEEFRCGDAQSQVMRSSDAITLALAQAWRVAHVRSLALCDQQQKLEADICGVSSRREKASHDLSLTNPPMDAAAKSALFEARAAENEAATRADQLLDQLFATPATTVAGVFAKLDALLIRSEVEDSPDSFPWPQIRSVAQDLKCHAATRASATSRGS